MNEHRYVPTVHESAALLAWNSVSQFAGIFGVTRRDYLVTWLTNVYGERPHPSL